MAKNKDKQTKFIWKKRKVVNINSESLLEVRNNIDKFVESTSCPSNNISQFISNFENLENCFTEKEAKNITLYAIEKEANFIDVEISKFQDLCDTLNSDRNTTFRSDVEITARDTVLITKNSTKCGSFYGDHDVSVQTPAGWASKRTGSFYCYSGYATDQNISVNTSDYSIDYSSQSCETYFASEGCNTENTSRFTVDENNYEETSNTDKQV
jgi:hypothetical protein